MINMIDNWVDDIIINDINIEVFVIDFVKWTNNYNKIIDNNVDSYNMI